MPCILLPQGRALNTPEKSKDKNDYYRDLIIKTRLIHVHLKSKVVQLKGYRAGGWGSHNIKINLLERCYWSSSFLLRTTLLVFLPILPQGSALHSPEKTKTDMISTRLDCSNKIHPCTAEERKGEGLEG